jgi:CRP/FNR family nitrogen fixation transcriptional regulator
MSIHQIAAFAATSTPLQPTAFPSAQVQPVSLYGGGSEIYGQGEKAGALYQIEFGAVRVYRLLADGRRQISAFHLAGELFGFESDSTHHFFAEAICATGVRVIRPVQGADLSRELLPLALRDLVRAQEHLLVLGRQSARERVAAFLLDMAERQGGLETFDLPMSRTDIGDYLGLTIETVSRVISQLRAKGIVRLKSLRTIEILKPNALRDMSE